MKMEEVRRKMTDAHFVIDEIHVTQHMDLKSFALFIHDHQF